MNDTETPLLAQLRNRYWVLRHGHSQANEQSLIVSFPEIGTKQFGLTEVGNAQVRSVVTNHARMLSSVSMIYASDFLRTKQTAELVADALGVEIEFSQELRERRFGTWEGTSNSNYEMVWQADAIDPTHQIGDVESVLQVATRMIQFVNAIDSHDADRTYLLVSHGDPLQILLTAAIGRPFNRHRRLKPLETAEVRALL